MAKATSTKCATLWAMPHQFAQHVSAATGQLPWKPYAWLRYLSQIIAQAVQDGNGRLVLNAPPQHGKSEFISHWVPDWFLHNWPHKRVILTSYGSEYAASWGRKVRNTLDTWPGASTKLAPDATKASEWVTTAGGGMVTGGIGTGISGRAGELIIVDDPIASWDQAYSAAYRRTCRDWFDSVLYARRQKDATIIVLMTRWHPEDLTGYLMSGEQGDNWRNIRLPAIAEANDPMGRPAGAALCPERFSLADLEPSKRNAAVWAALYGQEPTTVGVGAVYTHFAQAMVYDAVQLNPFRTVALCFDFNINPGMHAEIGQYDAEREQFTIRHEVHGARMDLEACLAECWRILCSYAPDGLRPPFPALEIFGDATGSAKTANSVSKYETITEFFRRKGQDIRVRVPPSNPRIADRVDTMQDALRDLDGKAHVSIHPECRRLVTDLRELRTAEDGLPDKSNQALSHASEATSYWVWRLRPIRRPGVQQHSAPRRIQIGFSA